MSDAPKDDDHLWRFWNDKALELSRQVSAQARRIEELEEALLNAAERLTWAAGIIPNDEARDLVGEWSDEARAALSKGTEGE